MADCFGLRFERKASVREQTQVLDHLQPHRLSADDIDPAGVGGLLRVWIRGCGGGSIHGCLGRGINLLNP